MSNIKVITELTLEDRMKMRGWNHVIFCDEIKPTQKEENNKKYNK